MVGDQNDRGIAMNEVFRVFFAAAVALLIAILSGLGIGSGGLFVIFLTAAYGISVTQARGMNLLFFVFSASAALFFHSLRRRIDLLLVLKLAIFSLIGTLVGTRIATNIDPSLLRQLFGAFLIVCGGYTLLSGKIGKRKRI